MSWKFSVILYNSPRKRKLLLCHVYLDLKHNLSGLSKLSQTVSSNIKMTIL